MNGHRPKGAVPYRALRVGVWRAVLRRQQGDGLRFPAGFALVRDDHARALCVERREECTALGPNGALATGGQSTGGTTVVGKCNGHLEAGGVAAKNRGVEAG